MTDTQPTAVRKRIEIQGIVQGVGFRPFVHRIAKRLDIRGWVLNTSDGVVIEAEGSETDILRFLRALETELPPLARIERLRLSDHAPRGDADFVIEDSVSQLGRFAFVPPDIATCDACAADFTAPDNRRFGYPFTNCTNCGPRYSIIRDVPYDRPKTTMAPFQMCARCAEEYADPLDRRFHAEPNACPECGPSPALLSVGELASNPAPHFVSGHECAAVLDRARVLLREGRILAIKGLGGFHLACDAANERSVNLLRERKRRSGKAFAVMASSMAVAERLCVLTDAGRALLSGDRRPIVLLPR
ncbi:MAG: acylphosphatase, partial [Bryobacteraceae bacterium]